MGDRESGYIMVCVRRTYATERGAPTGMPMGGRWEREGVRDDMEDGGWCEAVARFIM